MGKSMEHALKTLSDWRECKSVEDVLNHPKPSENGGELEVCVLKMERALKGFFMEV